MVLTITTLEANVEAISLLRSARKPVDLMNAGNVWANANGFDHWVYAIGAPASPRLIGTFPQTWMETARSDSELCDPLLLVADKGQMPITWDLESRVGIPSMLTVTRHRLLRESWDWGLRSGMTIPVASPDGRSNCVLTAGNTRPVDLDVRYRQEPFAVVFALYFQQALPQVFGETILSEKNPTLAPREVECLKWSSHGKTSAEIAQIVGIAASTVNFHISNAAKKFGVKGRTQAIQKAFKRRLIGD